MWQQVLTLSCNYTYCDIILLEFCALIADVGDLPVQILSGGEISVMEYGEHLKQLVILVLYAVIWETVPFQMTMVAHVI